MNILMIASWYQTENWKSGGSFFTEQANGLIRLGHKVYMLYCDCFASNKILDYINYNEQEYVENDNGLIILRKRKFCPLKHEINGHHKEFAKAIVELYTKYIDGKVHIDVVHAQSAIWAGYAALQLKKIFKLQYVITEHATFYEKEKKNIKKNFKTLKKIFDESEYNMCVSTILKKTLNQAGFEVDSILENMVDESRFCLSNRQKEGGSFCFVCIAHILSQHVIERKGLDSLIRCFAKVEERIPEAKLVIGGGGPAMPLLEDIIEKYNVSNILLLGQLSRDQVAQVLSEADCFVLPSVYETFGVVYIEALASGCPIIATNRTGLVPYVNEENGYIIEVGNDEQLIEAMVNVYLRRNLYDAVRIREKCIDQFSETAICNKIQDVYLKSIDKIKE